MADVSWVMAAAVAAYNKAKGSFFDAACFEPAPVEKRCGSMTSGLCIFAKGTSCHYKAKPCKPTDAQVLALFTEWNAALATLNSSTVADLYAPNAVLLPTVSNKYRETREEIVDYFDKFLQSSPQGTIDQSEIRHLAEGVVQNLGIYTFALSGDRKVQARYSYTYVRQANGKWLIAEHHSSAMPEDPNAEIVAAFAQWNAALATFNATTVAALYAPAAVLLPTVSNKVRNTRAEIEDYFVSFLKRKPQGVIDSIAGSSPNIRFLAPNVAINSGTYVFALTDPETGVVSNVQARFTYVYKKYGDYWLIEDHHSSVMPEPV
ncbi:hypothetical protein TSOC_003635 [Tetrabaena socialis]|uniref:Calcium/calmodulin-dependent protein kinase II association-domain domain-containing protein n=1 Tax=Tetrabaena socialis TaxID=47790 RepID=A0A2J8AB25_9CHLO|nr:hypothetical protein TSOC_003635 [Tetrabaena socialis]|eukprot:PNH09718.1 hypothetical protein TSOC_003635 [Tetrabaena socialis]